MNEILQLLTEHLLPHWPFLAIVGIFTVIGQFMSRSVFTRERAYLKQKSQIFWWWGRETMPLHPIITGILVGFLWSNPENADPAWKTVASIAYFAGAGVVSLFAWSVAKAALKKKGIDLELPGGTTSLSPPPLPKEEEEPDSASSDEKEQP